MRTDRCAQRSARPPPAARGSDHAAAEPRALVRPQTIRCSTHKGSPNSGGVPGRSVFPATMMPQILLRRPPDPTLQHLRVIRDDAIDVRLTVSRVHDLDRLEAQLIPARRLAQRDSEHHRRPESQRKNCGTARCLGKPPEERHPRRRQTHGALVDEKCDRMPRAQRTRNALHRFLVMNHGHADSLDACS